jgi:2-oxoglutarate ferredoxin oxidoreductase subunit beta
MVSAIAPKGAYVARGSMSKPRQLKEALKKALENQMNGNGFSFVEALSACPTNWRTNAKETWSFVEKEMPMYFKLGEMKAPDSKEGEVG